MNVAAKCPNGKCSGHVCLCTPTEERKQEIKNAKENKK